MGAGDDDQTRQQTTAGGPSASPADTAASRRARARWALRDDEKLSPVAKLVWWALDSRGEDPHPSKAVLYRNVGVGRGVGVARVEAAIRELEEAGWLRIRHRTAEPGDWDTNRYELTCPEDGGVGST